jgi:hypothetical protein
VCRIPVQARRRACPFQVRPAVEPSVNRGVDVSGSKAGAAVGDWVRRNFTQRRKEEKAERRKGVAKVSGTQVGREALTPSLRLSAFFSLRLCVKSSFRKTSITMSSAVEDLAPGAQLTHSLSFRKLNQTARRRRHERMRRRTILIGTLLSLPLLLIPAIARSQTEGSPAENIPTVGFCEMVRQPRLYFDKTIRLMATYQMGYEGQYLLDDACPLRQDDQIGAGSTLDNGKVREALNNELRKISTPEFGGRARLTLIGILRNQSRRDFVSYKYRFDIIGLEEMAHLVSPYEGELLAGKTYRAFVRGDKSKGLLLITPVRMPLHYALFVEWSNLDKFPALERLADEEREQQIVFSVIGDELKQMTVSRWNRTVKIKIIRLE